MTARIAASSGWPQRTLSAADPGGSQPVIRRPWLGNAAVHLRRVSHEWMMRAMGSFTETWLDFEFRRDTPTEVLAAFSSLPVTATAGVASELPTPAANWVEEFNVFAPDIGMFNRLKPWVHDWGGWLQMTSGVQSEGRTFGTLLWAPEGRWRLRCCFSWKCDPEEVVEALGWIAEFVEPSAEPIGWSAFETTVDQGYDHALFVVDHELVAREGDHGQPPRPEPVTPTGRQSERPRISGESPGSIQVMLDELGDLLRDGPVDELRLALVPIPPLQPYACVDPCGVAMTEADRLGPLASAMPVVGEGSVDVEIRLAAVASYSSLEAWAQRFAHSLQAQGISGVLGPARDDYVIPPKTDYRWVATAILYLPGWYSKEGFGDLAPWMPDIGESDTARDRRADIGNLVANWTVDWLTSGAQPERGNRAPEGHSEEKWAASVNSDGGPS